MAKHERIEADDITETRRVTFRMDGPLSAADRAELDAAMKRTVRNSSFEAKIQAIEPDLRRAAAKTSTPEYGSRPYYARELLASIDYVRRLRKLKSSGAIDAALAASMRVGWLAAECWAKHDWSVVSIGVRHRRLNREKGRRGGLKKGERAKRRDQVIARYAKQWEQSDELQDEHRSATAYVHVKTNIPKRTVRARLQTLKRGR